MRIAFGADERNAVTDFVRAELEHRGHSVTVGFGPSAGSDEQWADVGLGVGNAVARGEADSGIACCWTGTGVTIAANKVGGIRAALCSDAEQARGARRWNDANVLALSLRLTTEALVAEILDAWFSTEPDASEADNIAKVTRA
ncbi:MAG: RpiB/LacA/LacB family sugar-phosphate isomerase [Actinomycetota bacterium]